MIDATPTLRICARIGQAAERRQDVRRVQERQLRDLIARARNTAFGRMHDFGRISDVTGFQRRVPLRTYDDHWNEFWKAAFPRLEDVTWPGVVPFFATSSGTSTGRTKYIPCSREMVGAFRRAGRRLLGYHSLARPASRVLGGRLFMLGGSTDLAERARGVHSGDVSGIMAAQLPRWLRPRAFPPADLALIRDWEDKIARMAAAAPGTDIRLIGGTPSWLLLFFDALARQSGGPVDLARWFPRLELLVHGGVDFAPYRRRFEALLAGTRAELREVYPASEGFIAVADRGPADGMRLQLDAGLFYEFVPVDELGAPAPTRHWIADAEPGVDYALVLSSCAGLWGYVIGDTVELVGRDPPRVRVTGRTAYTLSAFGEHLTLSEMEAAVADAAERVGAAVTDWCVGALYPDEASLLGQHLFFVETGAPLSARAAAAFARNLDRGLAERNADYATYRSADFGMKAPEIRILLPGSFAEWMKSRGKLGGQHKVPRVVDDRVLFASIRCLADRAPSESA